MPEREQYLALIEGALEALADNPWSGPPKPTIHPQARVYLLGKPGRRARHLFVYEIVDGTAHIYGLLYDARDLPRIWKARKSP